MVGSILNQVQRNVLYTIQRTNERIAENQLALATGKDVNSALDSPRNYFASEGLLNRASDLSLTLDGISQSIRTIQEANIGVETMLKIIDQAESVVREGLIELFPATEEDVDPEAIQYIIDQNPDNPYFADTNNFYTNTTDFVTWQEASANASTAILNGVPEIRGHLATITSQEENDFVFALLTATSWLGGSDDEVEGTWRWVEGPEAGQQFWQGLAGGTAVNGAYTNWAPGEPNQFFGPGNPENYAHMRPDGTWNDLPNNQNLNYIIEWGGDLFIQNPDVNVSSRAMDYRRDYMELMGEIQAISVDANYRGLSLLEGEDLLTRFELGSSVNSRLRTQGIDATLEGLGLTGDNFVSKTEMTKLLGELDDAREALREYGSSLQNDLAIITQRRDFVENTINTLTSGSDDLVIADQNEIGSNLLALQVREQLQFEALSLSRNDNILDLFTA
ncbi:MAG: lectin-like protein [Pseudomonadota bacterium]